jgi:anti-sigma B factor antagonist
LGGEPDTATVLRVFLKSYHEPVDTSPTQPLAIQEISSAHPGIKIISLAGPVTIHNFSRLQELTEKGVLPAVLIVDLSAVPYIDSAALGSFVAIHVACESTGRKYALAGPNDRLKNLFDLAYVRTFLVIYDSVAEAETHLLGGGTRD